MAYDQLLLHIERTGLDSTRCTPGCDVVVDPHSLLPGGAVAPSHRPLRGGEEHLVSAIGDTGVAIGRVIHQLAAGDSVCVALLHHVLSLLENGA